MRALERRLRQSDYEIDLHRTHRDSKTLRLRNPLESGIPSDEESA